MQQSNIPPQQDSEAYIQTPGSATPPSKEEQTLREILEVMKRLEAQVNPPAWKKVISFGFSHVFLLLTLLGLLYGVWQIWDVVVFISGLISSGVEGFNQAQEASGAVIEQGGAIIDRGRELLPF